MYDTPQLFSKQQQDIGTFLNVTTLNSEHKSPAMALTTHKTLVAPIAYIPKTSLTMQSLKTSFVAPSNLHTTVAVTSCSRSSMNCTSNAKIKLSPLAPT